MKTDKEIVAEFMGYASFQSNNGKRLWRIISQKWDHLATESSDLHFDTDYNQLIPAWVKFRELVIDRSDYFDYLNHKVQIRSAITERPITEAFAALVEGIEWYNSLAVEKTT